MERYDFTIIGGGIFGSYTAIYLAEKGAKVCLIEKERKLFQKASVVNQARIHSGYHYPRSIATARLSEEYKARFIKEHRDFVNDSFLHYYAIDQYNSITDAAQFERFCDYLKIPCEKVKIPVFFKSERIEALFKTAEYSFDPYLTAGYYKEKVDSLTNIFVKRNTKIKTTERGEQHYHIKLENVDNQSIREICSSNVVSAAYAGTNGVLEVFDLPQLKLKHELTEIAFVKAEGIENAGLTVMDGQFCSLMPFGKSDFYSLSSVAYTPHEISKNSLPGFSCQQHNFECTSHLIADCNQCMVRPQSNFDKMEQQIRQYLSADVNIKYLNSKFTVKSKLEASHIDDSRPTEIVRLAENPGFYCIFAGKINSIYEVEKIL